MARGSAATQNVMPFKMNKLLRIFHLKLQIIVEPGETKTKTGQLGGGGVLYSPLTHFTIESERRLSESTAPSFPLPNGQVREKDNIVSICRHRDTGEGAMGGRA